MKRQGFELANHFNESIARSIEELKRLFRFDIKQIMTTIFLSIFRLDKKRSETEISFNRCN